MNESSTLTTSYQNKGLLSRFLGNNNVRLLEPISKFKIMAKKRSIFSQLIAIISTVTLINLFLLINQMTVQRDSISVVGLALLGGILLWAPTTPKDLEAKDDEGWSLTNSRAGVLLAAVAFIFRVPYSTFIFLAVDIFQTATSEHFPASLIFRFVSIYPLFWPVCLAADGWLTITNLTALAWSYLIIESSLCWAKLLSLLDLRSWASIIKGTVIITTQFIILTELVLLTAFSYDLDCSWILLCFSLGLSSLATCLFYCHQSQLIVIWEEAENLNLCWRVSQHTFMPNFRLEPEPSQWVPESCHACSKQLSSIVFSQCGHLAFCQSCHKKNVKRIKQCPICRSQLTTSYQIQKSLSCKQGFRINILGLNEWHRVTNH